MINDTNAAEGQLLARRMVTAVANGDSRTAAADMVANADDADILQAALTHAVTLAVSLLNQAAAASDMTLPQYWSILAPMLEDVS